MPDPIVMECCLCHARADSSLRDDWIENAFGQWTCGTCDQLHGEP